MRILLDECIDRRLAKDIIGHDVKTVPQMGWASIKNGELLVLAEKEFDVFLTVDRNLSFQQNLPKFNLAVVVLCASSNRLSDLKYWFQSFWICCHWLETVKYYGLGVNFTLQVKG